MKLGTGLGFNVPHREFGHTVVTKWKTDNISTGSSNADQVKLPLVSTGTYNFTVNWGDGNSDTITAYNQAEVTHTYAAAGTYMIRIYGTITGFQFNNGGDKLKILEILNWGPLTFGGITAHFYGCSNLDVTASDAPDLTGSVNLSNSFRDCSSLIGARGFDKLNVGNIQAFDFMFLNCPRFNADISNWNTGSATNMRFMFGDCTDFNQDISRWDVTNVTTMEAMLSSAANFNQPIGTWNTGNVANFKNFLLSAAAFDQNLENLNVNAMTDGTNMLANVPLSTANYDALLIGWAGQTVQNGVPFTANLAQYTSAAQSARDTLTGSPNNWSISDAGLTS